MNSWKSDPLERHPRLCQWSAVFGGLDFSRSLFLIYFAALGFTGGQTGVLQASLFWTSFLLELPSGIFADKYGRKKSVAMGLAALVAAFVVLAVAQTFVMAVVGFVIWGAAFAFISGAGAALLYDGLKECEKIETHLDWTAQTRGCVTVGLGFSIFMGGFLYEVLPSSVFWASAVAAALGFVLIWPVPEPRIHQSNPDQVGTMKSLKKFFENSTGRNLLIFLMGMAAIEMAVTPFFIFSQSLFHAQGLAEREVSMLLGGGFLLSSIFQVLATRFKGHSVMALVGMVGLIVAGGLGLLAWTPILPFQIFLFLIVTALPLLLFVHTDQYIQDHCESHIRASLLSMQSFMNAIFVGASYVTIGFLSDRIGMPKTLACLCLPVLLGMGLIAIHFARSHPEPA